MDMSNGALVGLGSGNVLADAAIDLSKQLLEELEEARSCSRSMLKLLDSQEELLHDVVEKHNKLIEDQEAHKKRVQAYLVERTTYWYNRQGSSPDGPAWVMALGYVIAYNDVHLQLFGTYALDILRCTFTCPHGDRCTLIRGHEGGHNHQGCSCNEPDYEGSHGS